MSASIRCVAGLLAVVSLIPAPASAQADDFQARYYNAYERGDYAAAEAEARRQMGSFKVRYKPGDAAHAIPLLGIANALQAQKKLDQALPLYLQALKLWQWERSVGISGRTVADTMMTVARIHEERSRDKDAESMYLRALKMRENADGADHPRTAQTRIEIGRFYARNDKRFDTAEAQYKKAIRILETAFGDKSPESEAHLIEPLLALVGLYEQRQWSRDINAYAAARHAAIPVLERIVAIRDRQIAANVQSAAIDIIEPLSRLVSFYSDEMASISTVLFEPSSTRAIAEADARKSSYFAKAEAGYKRLLALIDAGPSNASRTSETLKKFAELYANGTYNFETRADELFLAADTIMRQRVAFVTRALKEGGSGLEDDEVFDALQAHAELLSGADRRSISQATQRLLTASSDASYERLIALINQRHARDEASRDRAKRAYFSFAAFLKNQGRTSEAEAAYKTIITMLGTPKRSRDQLEPLAALADFYMKRGRYGEAEAALFHAIDIETNQAETRASPVSIYSLWEDGKSYSPETGLSNLILLYDTVGRSADAQALRRRIIDFKRKQFEAEAGNNDLSVAISASRLEAIAQLSQSIGASFEAETLYRRALAMVEPAKVTDSSAAEIATKIISGLTGILERAGKFDESLRLKEKAFAMWERVSPPGPGNLSGTDWTKSIAALVRLQAQLGKYADAEKLLNARIAILSKPFRGNPKSSSFAPLLLQLLGELHQERGNTVAAEQAYRKALSFKEEKSDRLSILREASVLIRLMFLYTDSAQRQKLSPVTERLLEISEHVKGIIETGQPEFALIKGLLLLDIGRQTEAQAVFDQVLKRMEASKGSTSPEVALVRFELSERYAAAGARAAATEQSRRAVAAIGASMQSLAGGAAGSFATLRGATAGGGEADTNKLARASNKRTNYLYELLASVDGASLIRPPGETRRDYFRQHIANLAAPDQPLDAYIASGKEAFESAQSAGQNDVSLAIQQMAFRFADRGDKLATLVRAIQDLVNALRDRDRQLLDALARANDKAKDAGVTRLRDEIKTIEERLRENAVRLENEFPDFATLANPRSVPVAELQKSLRSDEGLVFFLAAPEKSYVFAITDSGFGWSVIALSHDELAAKVAAFRRGLDLDEFNRTIAARKSPELFDLKLAHELYDTLLRPVAGIVGHKLNLIAVPSGPLTALPFHLLVTAPPKPSPQGSGFAAYRDAEWLLKRQAVSVLPSVASMRALRALTTVARARKPMVGFGDPVFGNEDDGADQRSASKVAARTRAYTNYWKGQGIDRDALGTALPRLADTADELNAIAKKLGAATSDIYLRQRATETEVKRAKLADYRIVYFATHGLVAGDVKGLGEPSLALTIPGKPTDVDDGLLTASEVAQLKLNADWVVLSACNTIAGDKPGAEALSGLARSFFYAGARALLVSHWAVDSAAATRLTTATFDRLQVDPRQGRAGALRAAMLDYLNDPADPKNAYPAFWAPFVVIGEGAAR